MELLVPNDSIFVGGNGSKEFVTWACPEPLKKEQINIAPSPMMHLLIIVSPVDLGCL
jgi:hypothetical protein